MSLLLSPFQLGPHHLQNRVVMAPMTRSRALGNLANDLMATYYGQRADVGLVVTEGVSPAPDGLGYARIPGLYDPSHLAGWRAVADAVHAGGARLFVQLMHTGRVGHPANLPAGARVLGPSPIAAPGEMWTDSAGMQPHPVPVEMTEADIEAAIAAYAHAASLAVEAGLDGVELHAANGYLIEQFLNVGANQRSDRWGGSVENRARFLLEVARRTVAAIGGGRVGVRLSPYGVFNGTQPDPDTDALYRHVAAELRKIGVVYLHLVDHSSMGAPKPPEALVAEIRAAFGGTLILSGGYDAARAEADLEGGRGELVAFGRPVLANPGFVGKLRAGAALNQPDYGKLYTPGAEGYTDYA